MVLNLDFGRIPYMIYVKTTQIVVPHSTFFIVLKKIVASNNTIQIHFNLTIPCRLKTQLSPKLGKNL